MRRLVLESLRRMTDEHGAGSGEKIGRKVVYALKTPAIAGTLQYILDPRANMTWGMFATVTVGVIRFLERWDNVEFAVNVDEREHDEARLGTAYLRRVR